MKLILTISTSDKMNKEEIIAKVRSSFCNLTSFRIRDNSLEVITAYSTLNSRFVSVFVTFTRNKIVLTDSGWIDQNYYETPREEDSEDIVNRVISFYEDAYSVKSTKDNSGILFYYKTCENLEQIPSAVFDLANFIVGVVNSFCLKYKDEKEEKERDTFRKDANSFLKETYAEKVKFKSPLDDIPSIKFNAIIHSRSSLFLLMYVTGSTQIYFENDLRKSIVNFEIAAKSKFNELVKGSIAVVNDGSAGYIPERSKSIFELLYEKTSRDPVKWSEKERLFEIIA